MIHDRILWLAGLLDIDARAELLAHAERLFKEQIESEPTDPGLGPWVPLPRGEEDEPPHRRAESSR